jgi:hypothetical protein
MKLENHPRYLLVDDFDEKSGPLSMRRSSWTIAASLPQLQLHTSFKDYAESLSLSTAEATSAILELLGHGLIHENTTSHEKSPHRGKTVRDLLKGTSSALALGVSGDDNPSDQHSLPADSPTLICTRLGELPEVKPSKSTIQGWISDTNGISKASPEPVSKPETVQATKSKPAVIDNTDRLPPLRRRAPAKAEKKKFKLQPIISQIEKLSKGGVEGTVLAYQVFLKVPAKLLRDEQIGSLHFVDADTEFSNPKLCQAIIRAVTEITGYHLKIEGYNQSKALHMV